MITVCRVLVVLALSGFIVGSDGTGNSSAQTVQSQNAFQLEALPYEQNALEPYISAKTMSFHYGKHHLAYVDNLNKLVAGTPMADQTLEKIVAETAGLADKTAIFNNAAQAWNHSFFWRSMKPSGGGKPAGRLLQLIETSFGSYEKFRTDFIDTAVSQFGSGWVWLVQEAGSLKIVKTSNADTPMAHGKNVLLTCDVWEHAYYLDYQNRRKDFVLAFLDHLTNWDFAVSRLK
jgi:Fe-Mn family superoxide dismutase